MYSSAMTTDTESARPTTAVLASPETSENIKVVVRCRPLSNKELDGRCKVVVEADSVASMVTVTSSERKDDQQKSFSFDHVFHSRSTQQEVYDKVARPIVQNVLEGYNGTIFAYGQTGTGKTFTMEGLCQPKSPELKGIIPNSFAQIFESISEAQVGQRYLVRCSYLEIYNENIRDLLCDDQAQFLELKENKDKVVYVKDLTSIVVCDADDMDRIMSNGNRNRSVASTNMNSVSSRSHAIFSIVVECSTDAGSSKGSLRMGKLNLVDLAGSERLSKTFATGDRLKEATKINLSLSNLGNVISALVDGSSYIPYRNSKLTRLLQDSLGGNSKTVMVATISPADFNYDETLSTLRYANRAKNIKNCAKINEDPKDAILRQYQEEILRLRSLLEQKKHELQERTNNDSPSIMSPRKRKSNFSNSVEAMDEQIARLLVEQKEMEERHKIELKALLEPHGIRSDGSHQEIMDQLEKRKASLMKDGKVVKEENERLFEELQQITRAMINSKKQCKELFHRIMYMEKRLKIHLTKDAEIRSKEIELAEQSAREENLRKSLELKQLNSNDLKLELTKLQNEIELKQKNTHKMTTRMQDHKEKLRQMEFSHYDNLRNLHELKIDLTKELKLKKLIVDNFIPRKIQKKIEDRIRYDEPGDKYVLAPRTDTKFEKPPVNKMLLNPYLNLTRFTKLSKVHNVHYSNENILAVEPEPAVPRSQELNFEEEDPSIANYIAETMQELNQELVIVCDHRKSRTKIKQMK